MVKPNKKKLASARRKLESIEKVIGPYSRPDQPQMPSPRKTWVPGDYLTNPDDASVVIQKQKQAETN